MESRVLGGDLDSGPVLLVRSLRSLAISSPPAKFPHFSGQRASGVLARTYAARMTIYDESSDKKVAKLREDLELVEQDSAEAEEIREEIRNIELDGLMNQPEHSFDSSDGRTRRKGGHP